MTQRHLDFIIIGAQKCATTALYAYLNGHPDIGMPKAKEAPYFVNEHRDSASWQSFCEMHYAGQEDKKVWGKASPQYMAGDDIAQRIHADSKDVKLIALLRDPISRAYSHYQMDVRRETEQRSFDEVVEALLQPERLAQAREKPAPAHALGYESESDFYLAWSEYGRILQNYLVHFPREQLLILQVDQLRKEPEQVLDQVLLFLGLDAGYRPANLGSVVHKGGAKRVISGQAMQRVKDLYPIKALWNSVSASRKEQLRYWFEQLNIKGSSEPMHLPDPLHNQLREHFATDLTLLKSIAGTPISWEDAYPG